MAGEIPRFLTHFPVLAAEAAVARLPILECGAGEGSTPLLSRLVQRRLEAAPSILAQATPALVTVEHSAEWLKRFTDFERPWHEFRLIPSDGWLRAGFAEEREWGLVFVDHGNRLQRGALVAQFADAKYPCTVVVHDTGLECAHYAITPELVTRFPVRQVWDRWFPSALILRNQAWTEVNQ